MDIAPRKSLNRREFVLGLLATAAATGCSGPEALLDAALVANDAFPESVPLYPDDFENWSGELRFAGLRTCAPRTPEDLAELANWCARNGHALRPRGAMHNWSPLSLTAATTPQTPLLLADMTQHLTRIEVVEHAGLPAVRAQAGATLEAVMTLLESRGYGFTAMPAVGNITIGGALAIDAHGGAVPALGEAPVAGQTFGTLSNRVLSLTAVVWDGRRYALRRFERHEAEIGALLTSLGRALMVEATLMAEPERALRCRSYVDIPADELFAPPGSGGRDLASFLDSGGRLEAIWYSFTTHPWLKVWSLAPEQPATARAVSGPYNYPFVDRFPEAVVALAQQVVNGFPQGAPLLGNASYAATAAGLLATASLDLWGASKNLLLWLRPETLRVHHASWVALTRRDQAQRVVSDFIAEYRRRRDAWQARGEYPMNMPIEIRVTGLDHAADTGIAGAQTALLSAAAPVAERPDWDTAVWLSMATIPQTPGHHAFAREIEQWAFGHYRGDYARLRPEWSKGWAYSDAAAWGDDAVLRGSIPAAFGRDWNRAIETLDALDPHRLYGNAFTDRLLASAG
jgi:FAD/FMN-containing dehydrogenase